jgi:hypothetical protein
VVGALAETVTTALGQLTTGLANNLNPMAKAQAGADMFKDLIQYVPSPSRPYMFYLRRD